MAKLVERHATACSLCRGSINGPCIMKGFELVCMDCAKEIYELLPKEEKPPLTLKCNHPGCGETFTNRGNHMAHCKKHRQSSFKDGLKTEGLA